MQDQNRWYRIELDGMPISNSSASEPFHGVDSGRFEQYERLVQAYEKGRVAIIQYDEWRYIGPISPETIKRIEQES